MDEQFQIREILPKDNSQLEAVVRKVFEDMNIPKEGTAYADPSLKDIYTAYQKPRATYFVVLINDEVIGGAGIAPLENFEGNVCELQKMYLLEVVRGKGIGTKLIAECLNRAKNFQFEGCYLETMPYMTAAQKLYKRNGFEYIDGPMGCTGHSACPVYMFKKLN